MGMPRHLKTRNHIAGKYYLDAEMQHLEEDQAPCFAASDYIINSRNEFVRHLPHAALMEKLAQAGKGLSGSVTLKSEGTLPYLDLHRIGLWILDS